MLTFRSENKLRQDIHLNIVVYTPLYIKGSQGSKDLFWYYKRICDAACKNPPVVQNVHFFTKCFLKFQSFKRLLTCKKWFSHLVVSSETRVSLLVVDYLHFWSGKIKDAFHPGLGPPRGSVEVKITNTGNTAKPACCWLCHSLAVFMHSWDSRAESFVSFSCTVCIETSPNTHGKYSI